MPTVNYSVPEDVKRAFNETFRGRNKSAIIADLMRQAVTDERLKRQRREAVEVLLERRDQRPVVNDEEIRRAREELRS